jgi:Mn-dependent DtxR family transcriptional regulator
LGVSRSVIREVIRHLETEGLVEMGKQGPIVATLGLGRCTADLRHPCTARIGSRRRLPRAR